MLAKHRFKIAVIILTAVFILLMRAVTGTAASNAPSIFINDQPYPHAHILPLHIENGVHYVPLLMFDFIPDIKKGSIDDFTDHFFIQHVSARGTSFIAFSIKNGIAHDTNSNDIPNARAILIGRGRNNIYVPARIVADTIGLRFEWDGAHRAVRISDGRATRSFPDMLQRYAVIAPSAAPTITTTAPAANPPPTVSPPLPPPTPITSRPDPNVPEPETTTEPETTPPENTRDINNYLMFYDGAEQPEPDNLGRVLGFLSANNIRALFFMSGGEIAGNPDKLRRIFVSGHDVGINIDRADFETAHDILGEADAANAYIYSLIKQKTRFYVVTADFKDVELMKDCVNAMRRAGYFFLRDNINIEAEDFEDIDSAVEFLKEQQANLFKFDLNNLEHNYLEMMAEAADIKFYINFSHINNANVSGLN